MFISQRADRIMTTQREQTFLSSGEVIVTRSIRGYHGRSGFDSTRSTGLRSVPSNHHHATGLDLSEAIALMIFQGSRISKTTQRLLWKDKVNQTADVGSLSERNGTYIESKSLVLSRCFEARGPCSEGCLWQRGHIGIVQREAAMSSICQTMPYMQDAGVRRTTFS
ncbi:hypothetical protein BDV95DRAFT_68577 [Massariosphaeria phaeospora]|uniref:Uncharacterized protein n=1 Tax=Massariosphaeria phaeospora TaxID=100035 RepID=A0A7C8M763_9PLEO|nr:hypothetical protein BDV95DRAFT_68577 [Massariosphaeria phaeospora]